MSAPRKLTDLNPHWIGSGGPGITDSAGNPVPRREGMGLQFDCPCGCGVPIFVAVAPLDGGPPLKDSGPVWECTGTDFATLSLRPSIRRLQPCTWHGWVTNGEVTTC